MVNFIQLHDFYWEGESMSNKKWWEEAIIYQIYPRSFQDTNDDGIGDIEGILQRLDYVRSLGVNTLWVNPLALSPQDDNGYDVIDYKKIDPLFGEQSEGKKLIEEIHKRGMKLIYDFPLHHTSIEHPWFKEAIKGKTTLIGIITFGRMLQKGNLILRIGRRNLENLCGRKRKTVTNFICICSSKV